MIDPSTRLRRAILLNDVLLVQRIIRNHPHLLTNPDFSNKSNTSLHLAASNGYTDIAELLISAGHDRSRSGEISRNSDHDTPLMLAAQGGHFEVGTILAKRFPRCIPYQNKRGMDALAFASQCVGSTSLIPILLQDEEWPASVEVQDLDGNTPLHHASASGSLKALRILLAAGANPLVKNCYDWTPLAYSQTVAAEVYFKNLVAEFERRKAEGAERERVRVAAGTVRLVEDGGAGGVESEEEEVSIQDALKRHWSPTMERRRPGTAGSGGKQPHEWGSIGGLGHVRTRSGSGD